MVKTESENAAEKRGHTQGRWRWCERDRAPRLYAEHPNGSADEVLVPYIGANGRPVIKITEADMALIEAAPELLNLAIRIAEFSDYTHDDVNEVAILHELQDAAQALVAKAEGRS